MCHELMLVSVAQKNNQNQKISLCMIWMGFEQKPTFTIVILVNLHIVKYCTYLLKLQGKKSECSDIKVKDFNSFYSFLGL